MLCNLRIEALSISNEQVTIDANLLDADDSTAVIVHIGTQVLKQGDSIYYGPLGLEVKQGTEPDKIVVQLELKGHIVA